MDNQEYFPLPDSISDERQEKLKGKIGWTTLKAHHYLNNDKTVKETIQHFKEKMFAYSFEEVDNQVSMLFTSEQKISFLHGLLILMDESPEAETFKENGLRATISFKQLELITQLNRHIRYNQEHKKFSFHVVTKHIDNFKSDVEKLQYLRRLKKEYLQSYFLEDLRDRKQEGNFDEKCDLEIVYLQEELEKQQNQDTSSNQKYVLPMIQNQESETTQIIMNYFDSIDETGWKYVFKSETDYMYFVSLLTAFLDRQEYKIPEKPIRTRKGTKTRLAPQLKRIYFEVKDDKLKSDIKFMELCKCLECFENEYDIYKLMTR